MIANSNGDVRKHCKYDTTPKLGTWVFKICNYKGCKIL